MKKIIFDFDGTLVDSMRQYGGVMLRILEENRISYPDDVLKIITPLGFIGTARYFKENFCLPTSEQEAIALMNEYAFVEYRDNIPAKKNVEATLSELKRRGYSINVLTASPHKTLDVCLKRLGLFELFDNVWSCDDFGTTKADVGIYHRAAERLGTTAENCIFLDDNLNADTVAKRSGMTVIGVYDNSSSEYRSEIAAVCDGYIETLDELLGLVDSL